MIVKDLVKSFAKQFDVFVFFSSLMFSLYQKYLLVSFLKLRSHRKSKAFKTFSCWTNCQTYMCVSKILPSFSAFWAFSQVLSTRLNKVSKAVEKPISSLWLVVMPRTVKLRCWEIVYFAQIFRTTVLAMNADLDTQFEY